MSENQLVYLLTHFIFRPPQTQTSHVAWYHRSCENQEGLCRFFPRNGYTKEKEEKEGKEKGEITYIYSNGGFKSCWADEELGSQFYQCLQSKIPSMSIVFSKEIVFEREFHLRVLKDTVTQTNVFFTILQKRYR